VSKIGQIARTASRWIPAALAEPFSGPTAVFFHGVERLVSGGWMQDTQHALDDFGVIAQSLKRDFDVMPLAALPDVLKKPERHSRAVFLMSDDGYANTLSLAADVLGGHNLPWTLFVSTHHIDTGDLVPLLAARAFFLTAPPGEYEIPHLDGLIVLESRAQREELARRQHHRLRMLDAVRARETLAAMQAELAKAGLGNVAQNYPSERFLTWPEVLALHSRGVEIGAHADIHWAMHDGQSDAFLREQAERPKRRIEQEIGPCRAFAYPFGNRGDVGCKAWRAVRDAGYDYAFTTIAGTLDASANNWLLPRYGLAPKESNLAALLPVLRTNNRRLRQWQSQIGT
jgi:peptidoglycan/xylan/chitin deacetylase (PgdA/CDA1 family)